MPLQPTELARLKALRWTILVLIAVAATWLPISFVTDVHLELVAAGLFLVLLPVALASWSFVAARGASDRRAWPAWGWLLPLTAAAAVGSTWLPVANAMHRRRVAQGLAITTAVMLALAVTLGTAAFALALATTVVAHDWQSIFANFVFVIVFSMLAAMLFVVSMLPATSFVLVATRDLLETPPIAG